MHDLLSCALKDHVCQHVSVCLGLSLPAAQEEEEVKLLQPTDYTHDHGHGVLNRAPEDYECQHYLPSLSQILSLLALQEEEVKLLQPTDYTFTHAHGHGVLERAPEDSVYYHPTLNPSGVPPPGKPQRYKTSVKPDLPASELPLPLPPPLPSGPAPAPGGVLPPPAGPPPGVLPSP